MMSVWYQKHFFSYVLWPFSWVYRAVVCVRCCLYRWNLKKTAHFSVPVIVVGNITVGGTGKTPLVIYLVNELRRLGWRPGIVSRGYGGSAIRSPQSVQADSDPRLVGDEAVLLARKAICPLVVCKDRVAAVAALLRDGECDLVISDDGLQHLALGRDIEIAVMDGARRLGNGFCLPAGPLREPAARLQTVDFIVSNGEALPGEWLMQLAPGEIYQLIHPSQRLDAGVLKGKIIHAVAGIGNPQRFFNTLENLGFNFIPHPFSDHYFFKPADLEFGDNALVIMTEKDAVKCHTFADERHWCLPVNAQLPSRFLELLRPKLNQNDLSPALDVVREASSR